MKTIALALLTLMVGCSPAMAQQQPTCWDRETFGWQEGYEVKQGVPG